MGAFFRVLSVVTTLVVVAAAAIVAAAAAVVGGGSWCVARRDASQQALQKALKSLGGEINIVEVERSGDELNFSVGIASAWFGIENFLESPQCGCGFDCGNGGVSKNRINPFGVSSY